MRCILIAAGAMLWACTALTCPVVADEPNDTKSATETKETTEPKDDARIIGVWKLVSKTQKNVETKRDDSSDDAQLDVTFEEQTWKTFIGPKGSPIEISGGYTLDPSQTPKLLDLTVRADGNSNDVYAIYKFEKEQLYIRIREGNGIRPVDFESQSDDCITLVFAREGK